MLAIISQACALAMVASKSLASLRLRPSQAKVRATCEYRKLDWHEGMVQATEVRERPDLTLTFHRSSSGPIFPQ